MRQLDTIPSDLSADQASRATPYKPLSADGKIDFRDFSPGLALTLALACGLHQLPACADKKETGLRGIGGIETMLSYIEANDETIWPTERLKNGVLSFTTGRLAGSVLRMTVGDAPVLAIVFGSPVDEGSAAAVTDALKPRHTGKHPSVDGAVIDTVATQWAQLDEALLDLVRRLRAGDEKLRHIFVAGHGLGASLAVLAAASLKIDGALSASDLTVYTFGAPMGCDARFTDTYDVLLKHTWRCSLEGDLVPSMTPEAVAAAAAAAAAADSNEPPTVCHVGKWVHLSRAGHAAWLSRGTPAVLAPAALAEQQRSAQWIAGHSARAYCEALQRVCAEHRVSTTAVDSLMAHLAPL